MSLKKNLIQVSFNNALVVINYLMAEYAVVVGRMKGLRKCCRSVTGLNADITNQWHR